MRNASAAARTSRVSAKCASSGMTAFLKEDTHGFPSTRTFRSMASPGWTSWAAVRDFGNPHQPGWCRGFVLELRGSMRRTDRGPFANGNGGRASYWSIATDARGRRLVYAVISERIKKLSTARRCRSPPMAEPDAAV